MMMAIHARRMFGIGTIVVALYAAAPADAHVAAERYIPLGQSPGVSHKLTVVGKIEVVDPERRSITIAAPSGPIVVEIRDETQIWLDRTKIRQTNLNGNFADLLVSRTVEVKFVDRDRMQFADWIKIEALPLR